MANDPCSFWYPHSPHELRRVAEGGDWPRYESMTDDNHRAVEDRLNAPCGGGEVCGNAKIKLGQYPSQTIPTAVWTPVAFDVTEIAGTGTITLANGVSEFFGRIRITESGDYLVGASVQWDQNTTGSRGIMVLVDDFGCSAQVAYDLRDAPTSVAALPHSWGTPTVLLSLRAGQDVYVQVWQDSGGDLLLDSDFSFGGGGMTNPIQWATTSLSIVRKCSQGTPLVFNCGIEG